MKTECERLAEQGMGIEPPEPPKTRRSKATISHDEPQTPVQTPEPPSAPAKPTYEEFRAERHARSRALKQPVDADVRIADHFAAIYGDREPLLEARAADAREREEAARRLEEKRRQPFGKPARDGADIERYKQTVRSAPPKPDLHPNARYFAAQAVGREQAAREKKR